MKYMSKYLDNSIYKLIILVILSLCLYIIKSKANIRVCLCTLAKLENKYIREFIQHYYQYGVDKIFLYDNNDINGEKFEDILKDYINKGFVEIMNWRGEYLALYKIMNDCYKKNYKNYDWLIFYEIDEYIHLYNYNNIKLFLNQKKFNECQEIYLNLVCHTDNNLLKYDNKPLAIRFPFIVPESKPASKLLEMKSIIRGHIEGVNINNNHLGDTRLKSCNSSGFHENLFRHYTLNGDKKYYFIDHYFSKSTEEFITKITKGDPLRIDKGYMYERINKYFDQNEITKDKLEMIEKKINISLIKYKNKIISNITNPNFIFENSSNINKFSNFNNFQYSHINSNITSKEIENSTRYDVCIVGLWYGRNYGGMLTYYALHETVKHMGYSVLMINDPLEPQNITYNKLHPKNIIGYLYNISQTKKLDNLYELNKICKCFLVGSDQIWNLILSRPLKQFFFLGFVNDKIKKFSYAPSFGTHYIATLEEKIITKKNLVKFNGISVRDMLSIDILKNIFGIKNAVQVCDPTFLCNITDYLRLANKANINKSSEYILAYILDPKPEIGKRLEKLSIDKDIKVIILLDYPPEIWKQNKEKLVLTGKGKIEVKNTVNINEWLWYYYNSNAVITDSFHGTVFSIIFRKPFITLKNIKRGESRFPSLLRPLKLMGRLFNSPDSINNNYKLYDYINFSDTINELEKIKMNSHNWLKTQLNKIK